MGFISGILIFFWSLAVKTLNFPKWSTWIAAQIVLVLSLILMGFVINKVGFELALLVGLLSALSITAIRDWINQIIPFEENGVFTSFLSAIEELIPLASNNFAMYYFKLYMQDLSYDGDNFIIFAVLAAALLIFSVIFICIFRSK